MAKALVLGGGGVAGIAWETGVLVGLADAGVDLTDADLLVGTSAGSVVAAQVATGVSLEAMYDRQVDPGPTAEQAVDFDLDEMAQRYLEMLADRPGPEELRRRVGAWALTAPTVSEAERRAIIEARLPVHRWSDRDLRIVAVDAATGEPEVFDRASGVDLVDAVAASCAVPGVWPPVTIDGHRYVDGGVRSVVNADLAIGHDRVAVLAPTAIGIGGDVDVECERLRREGAAVVVVVADERSVAAFGPNPLDPSTRAASAQAGREQASAVADQVAEVWR